eukprot:3330520-Rhodomonas_salina.2
MLGTADGSGVTMSDKFMHLFLQHLRHLLCTCGRLAELSSLARLAKVDRAYLGLIASLPTGVCRTELNGHA